MVRAPGVGRSGGRRTVGVGNRPAGEARCPGRGPDDEEPSLAWDLGRLLIPLPLRLELVQRLQAGQPPLPLVVATSPALADVPYPLLAVEETTPEQPLGRRLLEAAVVTLAPPSALIPEKPAGPAAASS